MKKTIMSPLCSAFVVPGLGQVINNQIRKGVVIFLAVFCILITAVVKIFFVIKTLLKELPVNELYPEMILSRFKAQDHTFLWFLAFIFMCLWLYSVIDAFIVGRRIDSMQGKNEIIFDR